jgi:hypothetical protein
MSSFAQFLGAQFTPGMIASGDFTNIATNNAADGVYTINGSAVAIGDIIDLDHPENNFDPALDLDAGGIKCRDIGSGAFISRQFAINSPLLNTLLAEGFTLVMEFYADATVICAVSAHDNDFNFDGGADATNDPDGFAHRTQVNDKNNNNQRDFVNYPAFNQVNKLAVTMTPTRTAGSLNGSPVLVPDADAGAIDATANNMTLQFAGVANERLRSFVFYEAVDDTDLPTLSAL